MGEVSLAGCRQLTCAQTARSRSAIVGLYDFAAGHNCPTLPMTEQQNGDGTQRDDGK
jgi:hypothetical protein